MRAAARKCHGYKARGKGLSVESYLQHAFDAGQLAIEKPGRGERIRYVAVDRTESWSDPEEKVRARAYAR